MKGRIECICYYRYFEQDTLRDEATGLIIQNSYLKEMHYILAKHTAQVRIAEN